jgi:hypothetical protein
VKKKPRAFRFMGVKLYPCRDPWTWRTQTEAFPRFTVSENLFGEWYAYADLGDGVTFVADRKPSKRAALDELRFKLRGLANGLMGCDLFRGLRLTLERRRARG